MSSSLDVAVIQERLQRFAAERDWERFHNPKNLAMALVVEAAELVEIFQWLTPEEAALASANPETRAQLVDEIADVTIYLIRLAGMTGVDVAAAVEEKMSKNEQRFPPTIKG